MEAADTFPLQQTGVVQDLEVMAQRRLGPPNGLGQLTCTDAAGLDGDEAQQSEPGGIGECPEGLGEALRLLFPEGTGQDRGTAARFQGVNVHEHILT